MIHFAVRGTIWQRILTPNLSIYILYFSLRDPLDGMFHEDFYKVLAQYKFTITFENAVCNDYVTEKFWRPFKVGSVPIVFGSPKIKVSKYYTR